MDLQIPTTSDIRTPSPNISELMRGMIQQTEQLSLALSHYSELFNERPLQRFQHSLTDFTHAVQHMHQTMSVTQQQAMDALADKTLECEQQQHVIGELEDQLECLLRQYQQLHADHEQARQRLSLLDDSHDFDQKDGYA